MDNKELKTAFEKLNEKIEREKTFGKDVTQLMKEKVKLLKIGYDRISEMTSGSEFLKNPRKYAKELSFLNTIKDILSEIKEPTEEIEKLIGDTYLKMRENGLGWILDSLPKKD